MEKIEELNRIYKDLEGRERLEVLKVLKNHIILEINELTMSNNIPYNSLFRNCLEDVLKKKNENMTSYKLYEEYQKLRCKIIKQLDIKTSTDTKMMTKEEYLLALNLIQAEGYSVNNKYFCL